MTDGNRDRTIIDLDELERQLREAAGPREERREQAQPVMRDDPLAELARIVEQDEPYRSLWSEGGRRREPQMGEPQAGHPAAHPGPDDDFLNREWHPGSELRQGAHPPPLVAEAARHSTEYRMADSEPVFEVEHPPLPEEDAFEQEPVRSRGFRRLALAACLGVLAIGGGSALMFARNHGGLKLPGGEPPVIQAETGPSKIQPENPGGVEVPNQDRGIYNKGTQDTAPVKVTGHAEQPVDVAQAPKADPATSIIPPPEPAMVPSAPVTTATTTNPQLTSTEPPAPAARTHADSSVLAALAPRRVKTVTVRPDGTIVDGHVDPLAPGSPAANKVASLGDAAPSTPAEAMLAPAAPAAAAGTTPVPAPRPRAVPTTTATPVKPAPVDAAAAPTKPKPVQVASVPPADAPAAAAAAPASGGFSVQLAAPASEQEARDTASKLSKRYADALGGLTPGIRKAEVNGKTIWRVRVGSMARDEATNLCVKIQGAGGQCFVAKN